MNTIGEMVVAIAGDNSNFDHFIDASQKKFLTLQSTIAQSSVNIVRSLSNIDGEMAVWGRSVDLIKQKQLVLKNEISTLISQGVDPLDRSIEKLQNDYYKLGNEAIALEKSQISLKDKMTNLSSTLGLVGRGLTLGVTIPLIGLAAAALKSTATMEMLEASFTTMLGSAGKATSLMTDLKKMAAVTPFETTDLANAAKTLLQFGVTSKDLIPTLQMLGDASGGSNARFSSMALVFGQIQSMGRLMGQDLLQLINAGFNPLQEISRKTGESMAVLKDKMTKGAISADMVSEAFKSATSEGGKFYKGMDTASKTLEGLVSTLKDDLATLGRSLVEDFLPTVKDTVKYISSLAQQFSQMDDGTKRLVIGIGLTAAAIGPLTIAIGQLTAAAILLEKHPAILAIIALATIAISAGLAINELAKNTREFNYDLKLSDASAKVATESYRDAGTALMQLRQNYSDAGVGIKLFIDTISGVAKPLTADQKTIDDTQKKIVAGLKQIDEQQKLSLVTKEKVNVYDEKRKLILDELSTLIKAGFTIEGTGIQSILTKYEDLIITTDEAAQAENDLKEANDAMAARFIDNTGRMKISRDDALNEMGKAYQENVDENITMGNFEIDKHLAREDLRLNKTKSINKAIIIDHKKKAIDILSITKDLVNNTKNLVDQITKNQLDALDIQTKGLLKANDEALQSTLELAGVQDKTSIELAQSKIDDNKTAMDQLLIDYNKAMAKETDAGQRAILTDNYNKDKARLDNNALDLTNALTRAGIEQTFADNKKAIEKQAAKDKYNIELKQYETNKAFALVSIAIDTATAIVKALPNLVLSGLALLTGGIQAAIVMSQSPPSPPALASGGIVMPSIGGTVARVAEAGQPEVIFPLDQLNKFLRDVPSTNTGVSGDSGGNINLIVQIDSEPILKKIFPATKNRTVTISAGAVV
jgi:tape measure domain-containing protein